MKMTKETEKGEGPVVPTGFLFFQFMNKPG